MSAITEAMLRSLCGVLGVDHLLDDARFTDGAARLGNRDALWAELEERFLRATAIEWLDRLQEAGVPAALVNSLDDVFSDEQVLRRVMVFELVDPRTGAQVRVLGRPIKLRDTGTSVPTFPPRHGADTAAVLRELLDVDDDRIVAWQAAGVLGHRRYGRWGRRSPGLGSAWEGEPSWARNRWSLVCRTSGTSVLRSWAR